MSTRLYLQRKEWAVLKRLQHYSRSFTEYAGCSVPELIAIAQVSRFDFQEHQQEFTEKVHRWGTTHLKRRQIRLLASFVSPVREHRVPLACRT